MDIWTWVVNSRDVIKIYREAGRMEDKGYFKEVAYSGSKQPQLPVSGDQSHFSALGWEGHPLQKSFGGLLDTEKDRPNDLFCSYVSSSVSSLQYSVYQFNFFFEITYPYPFHFLKLLGFFPKKKKLCY
jgi:hypothetical protein